MTCAICREALLSDLSTLKCGHVYHTECIKEMEKNRLKSCPTCRSPFMKRIKLILSMEEERSFEAEAKENTVTSASATVTLTATRTQQTPAPVNESLEHLEMHIGNLESRLEFYREENSVLKGREVFFAERIHELERLEEAYDERIGDLKEQERELQCQVHSAMMRYEGDRQVFHRRVTELESQLKAEREVNWNLRNLRVAESTRRLCRKLEELGDVDLKGFDSDELRRRLLATTILAQEERQESEKLKEELRKTQIRLERAEKAILRPPSTAEEKEPEVQYQESPVSNDPIGPLVNPFAQRRPPLHPKVSNLMIPTGAKIIKSKSGAVMNGFGAPSKVIKFPDGKAHFM